MSNCDNNDPSCDSLIKKLKRTINHEYVEDNNIDDHPHDNHDKDKDNDIKDEYDVMIFGTGLTECILAGLLAMDNKKILLVDDKMHYGGEFTSYKLDVFFDLFNQNKTDMEKIYGLSKWYNIDMTPKFVLSQARFIKLLKKTNAGSYLQFRKIDGNFIISSKKMLKISKKSPDKIFKQKKNFKTFINFIESYAESDKYKNVTVNDFLEKFNLSTDALNQIIFGYGMHNSDIYLSADSFIKKVKLYIDSLNYSKLNYNGANSPFIYPLHGLGELPQAFARVASVHGTVIKLNSTIGDFVYDNDNKNIIGTYIDGKLIKCDKVIATPTYFKDKMNKAHSIVKCMCILDSPIQKLDGAQSCQIIIPFTECKRKSNIYITYLSNEHNVTPEGKYIAIASTFVETDNPYKELDYAMKIIGYSLKQIYDITDVYEQSQFIAQNTFITKSYDSSINFESICDDALDIYEKVTGIKYIL